MIIDKGNPRTITMAGYYQNNDNTSCNAAILELEFYKMELVLFEIVL